ncbi:MAG TPA: rhodanese-like domain-containing protein [Campylobacterales bacterium]|nr:rhodanese-like domain-containing protein [Campylobacterales bacterium]
MSELLKKTHVNSNELTALLEARAKGEADFILVDVREQMEYDMGHVKGVDMLKPTSTFQSWGENFLNENRDKTVIFTCRTDHRSGNVQRVFQQNGMTNVINHSGGIVSYRGEIAKP